MIEREFIVTAWVVAALFGVLYQVLLLLDERRSLLALKRTGRNGPARLVAMHDIRSDAICLVVMLIVLVVGSAALVVVHRGEPPFSPGEKWVIDNFWRIIGYGVLISVALLFLSGWLRLRDRHQLFNSVAEKAAYELTPPPRIELPE